MTAEQVNEPSPQAPKPDGAATSASVEGYIDGFDGTRLAGWAFDHAQPEAALQIEVHHRGERISTGRADRLRADLKRVGIGDGCHAFEITFNPPLTKEVSEGVSVLARSADGQVLKRLSGAAQKMPAAPGLKATPGRQLVRPVAASASDDVLRALRREIDAALRVFVQQIRTALSESCTLSAAAAESLQSAAGEIAARQETLAEQMTAFEVFQARFDATLTAMEGMPLATAGPHRSDRGLRIAIAGLAMLSAASLIVGLLSIWR